MAESWLPGEEIAVEVAWGADLTADPDTWSWTDVTGDVYESPGVSITLGRGDEASTSQPASCSLLLRNESGDYSLGGQSANWPNVRQGTPVRVRVDPDGDGLVVVFQGNAVGWTPSWDLTGTIPAVSLEAAGALRRLAQGASPLQSAYARGTKDLATAITYFPCEDGKAARVFWPYRGDRVGTWTGQVGLGQTGTPELASNTDFDASAPLPVLKGANIAFGVPPYTPGPDLHATMLAAFPEELESGDAGLIELALSDSSARWVTLYYYASGAGALGVVVYDSTATVVDSHGPIDFGLHNEPRTVRLHLVIETNGSDLDISYGVARSDGTAQATSFTVAGLTLAACTNIQVNGVEPMLFDAGVLQDTAVGHLVLRTDATSFFDDIELVEAWAGETADDRIRRLAAEQGELVDVIGTSTTTMGPQSQATFLELLRECEAADDGVLYDGLGPGLTYVCRTERENRPTDLTVDAGAGRQLAAPFAPVHDDQRIRNRVAVTRKDAATFVHEDTDGPLGSAVVGLYDTAITVNVEDDPAAQHLAEWRVHAGTQEGYRYPELSFDLRATPALGPGVLALTPSARVDVDDIDDSLVAHPGSGTSLLVEGLAHELTGASWRTTAKASPFDPWRVAQLSADSDVITYVGAGSASSQATPTTLSPALPTGLSPGDLVLCWATVRTGTVVAPDGWTALATTGGCSLLARIYREGDEAPALTFAGTAANGVALAQCFAFRGTHRNLNEIVHAVTTQSNTSAQNIAVPALTITDETALVLVLGWKADDWTSVASLAGQFFTEASEADTTDGDDAGIAVQYRVNTAGINSVTATNLVVTGGANAVSRAVVIALAADPERPLTRLDTDGSTLAADVSAGATSISVTTTSGPLWTTDSDDMPYDLDIGGVRFTVTACADATSPQTMTIAAAPVARSSGAPVKLWRPPVLAR